LRVILKRSPAGYWAEAQTHIKASAIPSMLEECEIRAVHEMKDLVAMGTAQIELTPLR